MIISVHRSSGKVSVILVGFYLNLNFRDRFSNNTQKLNFVKIHTVGTKLFDDDRQKYNTQTHGPDEADSRFPQFYESA
jgi:hypothetical protein